MNKINAEIIDIKRENDIVLIKLKDRNENIFSVLILDFNNHKIHIGLRCDIVFKESEVMISNTFNISARNKFRSKVISIKEDSIFARIIFDFYGKKIQSLITKEAKEELNIKINDTYIWFIKSNELILQF